MEHCFRSIFQRTFYYQYNSVLVLTNKGDTSIEIIIEPAAESFNLDPRQTARFEIEKNIKYFDSLDIEITPDYILIFEARQMKIKIYVDENLVYYTS